MAFDLLYRDGRDLSARPLRDRRARLEDVVAGSELVFPVRRLAHTDGLRYAPRREPADRAGRLLYRASPVRRAGGWRRRAGGLDRLRVRCEDRPPC